MRRIYKRLSLAFCVLAAAMAAVGWSYLSARAGVRVFLTVRGKADSRLLTHPAFFTWRQPMVWVIACEPDVDELTMGPPFFLVSLAGRLLLVPDDRFWRVSTNAVPFVHKEGPAVGKPYEKGVATPNR